MINQKILFLLVWGLFLMGPVFAQSTISDVTTVEQLIDAASKSGNFQQVRQLRAQLQALQEQLFNQSQAAWQQKLAANPQLAAKIAAAQQADPAFQLEQQIDEASKSGNIQQVRQLRVQLQALQDQLFKQAQAAWQQKLAANPQLAAKITAAQQVQ